MKKTLLIVLSAAALIAGCRKIEIDGDGGGTPGPQPGEDLVLKGRIESDRTLKAGNIYKLRDVVYITAGAKLTIEPGTIIQGEKSSRGTLVITRGAQIIANGTSDKPIIFTSDAATPVRGDWGGIVICGRARTNQAFNSTPGLGEVEGGVNNADGLGLYGGADDNDNSGVLKYMRIEYAGYAFLPDKELNGLTLASVGRGTTIENVQVSYANDDSFEWFGGTVDCKYLIAYKGLDDDFDADNGYSGRVQFGISLRDSAVADISGSNGFEIDNDAGGSATTPLTSAIFSNMTVIGPREVLTNVGNSNFRRGIHLRRNCAVSIFNSVIMGWPTGWLLDASTGVPTDNNVRNNSMVIANSILAGNNSQISYSASTTAPTGWTLTSVTDYFNRTDGGNTLLTNTADAALTAPFKYDNTVDFNPAAGSPALSGAAFANTKITSTFFKQTTYRGACGAGDTWWKGWTKFN
jgi:hypothetical protein